MVKKKDPSWKSEFREIVTQLYWEGGHLHPESDVQWYPATDALVTEDEFVVRMDISGVRGGDLRVMLEADKLHVRGTRHIPEEECKHKFHKL